MLVAIIVALAIALVLVWLFTRDSLFAEAAGLLALIGVAGGMFVLFGIGVGLVG